MARGRKAKSGIEITNSNLSKLIKELPPSGKPLFHWDATLKGFGVKATSEGLTYIVQARKGGASGQVVRYVIGKVSEKNADIARKEAREALSQIHDDKHLNEIKRQARKIDDAKELTLEQAYAEVRERSKWGELTVKRFNENFKRTLADWHGKPVISITSDMVLLKHTQLSAGGVNGRGKTSADQSMRILRRIFNYVMLYKKDGNGQALIQKNPVTGALNQKETGKNEWNKPAARRTIVRVNDLPAWYQSVINLPEEWQRDLLLLMMFTGLRIGTARRLTWDHFDIKNKVLVIPGRILKQGKKDLELPITDMLLDIYKRRLSAGTERRFQGNPYVFPARYGKGNLSDSGIRKSILKARAASGVKDWSCHDLRRSFTSYANSLHISQYHIKYLDDHSVGNDTTGSHYIPLSVEDVRETAQRIADFIKEKTGMTASIVLAANG